MIGVALWLAQHLRIHRNGTVFKLSPFGVEIRRRSWWQICNLDCLAAEAHGSFSSIPEDIYDVALSLNIGDIDISADAINPPRSKSTRTDMIFCLAGSLITRTMCRINHEPLGGYGTSKSRVKALEDKLKPVLTLSSRRIIWPHLPLATHQVKSDHYNYFLFPVSNINFSRMAADGDMDPTARPTLIRLLGMAEPIFIGNDGTPWCATTSSINNSSGREYVCSIQPEASPLAHRKLGL